MICGNCCVNGAWGASGVRLPIAIDSYRDERAGKLKALSGGKAFKVQ